jgi:hypothetical protein
MREWRLRIGGKPWRLIVHRYLYIVALPRAVHCCLLHIENGDPDVAF